ncbi:MAG: SpoVG family protein [Candidatus Omnitrophica bacterium]|nr:SpoVG family protein [Candidatus Omnitrophota bacterium]
MEITEVRVSLHNGDGKRLKAYVTVTFDNCFVVRNIKIIEGNNGLFVAMPARKMKQFCSRCGKKTDVGVRYCSSCGVQLPPPPRDVAQDKTGTHQDLAHPITQEFRDYLQKKVLDAYYKEKEVQSSKKSFDSQTTTGF